MTAASRPIGVGLALLATLAIATLAIVLGTDSAQAKSTIFSFATEPSSTQAGGHPDIFTRFEVGNRANQPDAPCECNDAKDITIHAPPGVVANTHVVSKCTAAELATRSCPADSQVGVLIFWLFNYAVVPVYNTVPQAGQAGALVFLLPLGEAIPVYTAVNARTGSDYGLDLKVQGITHFFTPPEINILLWGVPGDPIHDQLRFAPREGPIVCNQHPVAAFRENVLPEDCFPLQRPPVPFSLPVEPLIEAPTTCSGPMTASLDTLSYDHGTDHQDFPWPATTGCDKLTFDPSLSAVPTTTETDSPSGLGVDLKAPQYQDPNTPSPSQIRASTLTLPEGFSINPNAADGKVACTDAQANFGSEEPSSCPEFSKVGTAEVDSSALPEPIRGFVYLGEPKPGDQYRVIIAVSGFGTNVKIAGSVNLDPQTGQVVTRFEDLPQAPFQRFTLHLFGAERGLLATPERCGTYAVKTTFVPWAGDLSDQTSTQFFSLDSSPGGKPCPTGPRPFAPSLQAGTIGSTAGTHTPFGLRVDRADGEQNLAGLNVRTPPGFSATLKGIPYCSEAAIAKLQSSAYTGLLEQALAACPAASRVGSVVAGGGAGSRPLFVGGKAYLAGPYKGAPASFVVVVPAVSGPYDLGNLVVRVALYVDPATARVNAVSDPFPQMFEGVPLRARMVQIDLDRPGFTLNPTNCDPFAIETTVLGDEGAQSTPRIHFQVANCADLPFSPKLSLSLKGSSKRRGHPALSATLTASPGEANSSKAVVAMPPSLLLDNAHIGSICTRVKFAADDCPAGSILGDAEATTPLLDNPLKGKVYLRSSSDDLPNVVVSLKGQFEVELVGRIDTPKRGGLRTTFEGIPDAPVSQFTLSLEGGNKGLLINGENLCKARPKAKVQIRGQNDVVRNRKVKLRTNCRSKAKRKRHRAARRAHR